jgi:hypothetical protein
MDTSNPPLNLRSFGITSVVLGLLGGALCWWAPLGVVVSICGFLTGFIGWSYSRRGTVEHRLLVGGMLVSLATLLLCCIVAALGLEFIRFSALR